MKSFISSTTDVLKSLILPAMTATTGFLAHNEIQTARQFPSSLAKDNIKDQTSQISSTVSAFAIGYSSFEFIALLIRTGMWDRLSSRERLGITATTVIGVAGSTYAMIKFGVEQQTVAAALSSAAGIFALNVSSLLVNRAATETLSEETRPIASRI